MLRWEHMKAKNTVPSAPEDMLEPGKVFADGGRKRQDASFVGAKTPDTDADVQKPYRRRVRVRVKRALRGRSVRRASASRR
jgi:hypothetical protein